MIRTLAIVAAVFVTLLWSSSYILNQLAFAEGVGPFTLAGLRYSLAVCALWLALRLQAKRAARLARPAQAADSQPAAKPSWLIVAALGLAGFLLAQGLQYAGQYWVTPTQTSLVLGVGNTLFLLVIDRFWLRELRSFTVFIAILIAMAGVAMYAYPWQFTSHNLFGVILIAISCIGYTVHLTLSRYWLANKKASPASLVLRPMLIGAIGMLIIGFILEGIPRVTLPLLLVLVWLGPINGALAFTLWAWSQKQLRAYESSLINNLMLLEVAGMDLLFLGRGLTPLQAIALLITGIAIVAAQFIPRMRKSGRAN